MKETRVWSIGGMILTEEKWSTWRKSCPSAHFVYHKFEVEWTGNTPGGQRFENLAIIEPVFISGFRRDVVWNLRSSGVLRGVIPQKTVDFKSLCFNF
jgi:hypothetical protein